MIFNKIFNIVSKKNIIKVIEEFKEIHKDNILLEEVMIDKKGKEVHLVVTYDEESKLGMIYIFSNINEVEKVNFIINDETLLIADIKIFKNKNRGIGTRAISMLEQIAIDKKVLKMEGQLFSTDEENREKQLHFYKKNGFTIKDNTLEKIIKSG